MKQRLVLQHLRGDLLALRALLHNIGRWLPASLAPTTGEHVEDAAAARIGSDGVRAAGLSEQRSSQPASCPGGAWQKIDSDLAALALGVHRGERPGKALKRIGVEREVRQRLAARPRQSQLGSQHTPLLAQRRLGGGAADLYPVVVAER